MARPPWASAADKDRSVGTQSTQKSGRDYGVVLGALMVAAVVMAGVYALGYAQGDSGQAVLSPRSVGGISQRASVRVHNASDVRFFATIEPHHEHTVDMAQLAERRATSKTVRELAFEIDAAQGLEIDAVVGWLDEWGTAVSVHGGPDEKDYAAELRRLERTPAATIDKRFLETMIAHHKIAIAMASRELRNGVSAPALALAASLQVREQAEVAHMESLQR